MRTLSELAMLFTYTGIGGHPVISTAELKQFSAKLSELADYMRYRGDKTMMVSIFTERECVQKMISARNEQ